ncbi:TVP38/TMEM64 family protein [Limimaricola hongkongensis]|uniref:TVP38/TMEM64 family membrane protein n=1 Tax=Limimaricola hongkongensis DSM 17492 TaxID=1122180 RepID=A0A017HGX6_9RHOB|nr:VTT domain-containing protein [Limimaricola hongkongensis]EYD73428.1 putative membrane protein [Limimaricola hongkongensis DSM 17492]
MTGETTETSASSRPGWARYLPLAVIGVVALAGAVLLRDVLSFETLRDNREALIAWRDANYALAVAGFIAAYVVIVAFSLPGATVATLTGGFLFGTFPGVVFNVTGATIGAILIFLAARAGLGRRLSRGMDTSEGRLKKIKDGIHENQWSMLFLLRLLPVVPFFVANLLPALVGVGLGAFAITTFLGIAPGALVFTSVGAGLGAVFAAGETPDLGLIFEPHILLPLLGLAALSALPLVIKAVKGRKGLA